MLSFKDGLSWILRSEQTPVIFQPDMLHTDIPKPIPAWASLTPMSKHVLNLAFPEVEESPAPSAASSTIISAETTKLSSILLASPSSFQVLLKPCLYQTQELFITPFIFPVTTLIPLINLPSNILLDKPGRQRSRPLWHSHSPSWAGSRDRVAATSLPSLAATCQHRQGALRTFGHEIISVLLALAPRCPTRTWFLQTASWSCSPACLPWDRGIYSWPSEKYYLLVAKQYKLLSPAAAAVTPVCYLPLCQPWWHFKLQLRWLSALSQLAQTLSSVRTKMSVQGGFWKGLFGNYSWFYHRILRAQPVVLHIPSPKSAAVPSCISCSILRKQTLLSYFYQCHSRAL